MRKRFVFLFVMLMVCALAFPLSAQDATPTPAAGDGQMGGDMGSMGMMSDVTRVQIGHFSPDAPAVVPYVNGQPTLQPLSFPSLTGWIEFPGTSFNLTLVPEGAAQSQAVIGPVTISNTMGGWLTLIVTGSAADGTLGLYALNQPTGGLSAECARVVVFHGIEGGPTVDLQRGDGMSMGANLMFPGGMMSGDMGMMGQGDMTMTQEAGMGDMMATQEAGMDMAGQTGDMGMMDTACATSTMMEGQMGGTGDMGMTMTQEASMGDMTMTQEAGMGGDMMATQEAGMMGQGDMGMDDMGMMGGMRDYSQGEALTCTLVASLNMAGDMMGQGDMTMTQEAGTGDMTMTQEAGMGGMDGMGMMGQTFQNCAYVFDTVAGSGTFGAFADGAPLADFSGSNFAANTYTFIAIVGMADAPQVFTFTIQGSEVDELIANEQGRMALEGGDAGMGGGMEATATPSS